MLPFYPLSYFALKIILTIYSTPNIKPRAIYEMQALYKVQIFGDIKTVAKEIDKFMNKKTHHT